MRLKPTDFRPRHTSTEEGEERAEIALRRPSLRPNPNSLEFLRHEISRKLGIGVSNIRKLPPTEQKGRRHEPILSIPMNIEHIAKKDVLGMIMSVINRIANRLKVVSPRHLRPKRVRHGCHEQPIPRRRRAQGTCKVRNRVKAGGAIFA